AFAETGLTRMSKVRAMSLEEEGEKGASTLARLVAHPERFLNPVLLVLLACQITVATLVGILAENLFGAIGVVIATAFEVIVIFVFAEPAPKTWAVQHPDRAALSAARPSAALARSRPLRPS